MNRSSLLRKIRQVWISLGILATIIFAGWSLIAYRAAPEARLALRNDSFVSITHENGVWRFIPAASGSVSRVGLLFFPGALVDPVAYAPLARAVAEAGFPAFIVELPRRGAFGGADDPQLEVRAMGLMRQTDVAQHWVLGGHSRGAVVASLLASRRPEQMAGLILIGTSHPRDVSLAALPVPVTKIIATHDGLASLPEVEENKNKLPPLTNWVRIEGGNHSQFGWYGFQPGDRFATISPASQREQMVRSVIETLRKVAAAR